MNESMEISEDEELKDDKDSGVKKPREGVTLGSPKNFRKLYPGAELEDLRNTMNLKLSTSPTKSAYQGHGSQPEKKPLQATSETVSSKPHESEENHISYWILGSILVILISSGLYYMCRNTDEEAVLYTSREIFQINFEKLNEELQDQPKHTLKTLNITISETLFDEDPPRPGVILLLGTEGNYGFLVKVKEQIIGLITEVFAESKTTTIKCQNLPRDISEAKLSITNQISDSMNGKNLLVIENVDYLPAEGVATLQPYFDHENAPYRNVIYLLTAVTNRKYYGTDVKSLRELAMNHLDEKWSEYAEEHRDAMYARMLNSVAVLVTKSNN